MLVFPETRMVFPDPCMFFQKPACLSQIHACSSRNTLAFHRSTRVFPETRMSFPDPCLFFQKHACLSQSHACFSGSTHVFPGSMLVFLETRMSFSEPCVFLQKHACSSESMYVQRKTLRTKAYVIVNRGVFHVTPVRRPNLVFHFDCSFMPAGIFRDVLQEQLALKSSERQKLPKYGAALLCLTAEKLALITLGILLNVISRSEADDEMPPPVTAVSDQIGPRCQLERKYDLDQKRAVDLTKELRSRNRNRKRQTTRRRLRPKVRQRRRFSGRLLVAPR